MPIDRIATVAFSKLKRLNKTAVLFFLGVIFILIAMYILWKIFHQGGYAFDAYIK
jgi:NhaP-type Na+/H+ or K+/H+ antiporter